MRRESGLTVLGNKRPPGCLGGLPRPGNSNPCPGLEASRVRTRQVDQTSARKMVANGTRTRAAASGGSGAPQCPPLKSASRGTAVTSPVFRYLNAIRDAKKTVVAHTRIELVFRP